MIGIVIGNLGTPASPSPVDVKAYLKEFLMDPYVIDKPAWLRWLLVNVLIAPLRSKKSAEAYESVWRDDGSPLLALTQRLAVRVQSVLGPEFQVEIGMRYGEPSTAKALDKLKNCDSILLFPQYPQYAESSYRTWMEDALAAARKLGIEAKLSAVEPFYNRPEYLQVLAAKIQASLANGEYDHLLLSFHGLPESHVTKTHRNGADCATEPGCAAAVAEHSERCYRAQCYAVARAVAQRLSLQPEKYSVSFQSRLGREPWIEPFTDVVIRELPKRGVKRLAMAMPAFTVDCLETLEEIHIRARKDFLAAGGREFHPVACLNDDGDWVAALVDLIKKSLASPVKPCP
jgi:ferrochelatase